MCLNDWVFARIFQIRCLAHAAHHLSFNYLLYANNANMWQFRTWHSPQATFMFRVMFMLWKGNTYPNLRKYPWQSKLSVKPWLGSTPIASSYSGTHEICNSFAAHAACQVHRPPITAGPLATHAAHSTRHSPRAPHAKQASHCSLRTLLARALRRRRSGGGQVPVFALVFYHGGHTLLFQSGPTWVRSPPTPMH
jgi:hypothetical protein